VREVFDVFVAAFFANPLDLGRFVDVGEFFQCPSRMKKRALNSAELLLPGHWVEFQARLADGTPIGNGYRTEWRVTNNGPVAASKNQPVRSTPLSCRAEMPSTDSRPRKWPMPIAIARLDDAYSQPPALLDAGIRRNARCRA
jgi:hypothetical protein